MKKKIKINLLAITAMLVLIVIYPMSSSISADKFDYYPIDNSRPLKPMDDPNHETIVTGLVFEDLDAEWLDNDGWDGSEVDAVRLTNNYTNITLTSHQLFVPDEIPIGNGTVIQYYLDEFYYVNKSARVQYALQFSPDYDYKNPDLNALLGNKLPSGGGDVEEFVVWDGTNQVLYTLGQVVSYLDKCYICICPSVYNHYGVPPNGCWELTDCPGEPETTIYPQNYFQTGSKVIYSWNINETGRVFDLDDLVDVNAEFNVSWKITVSSYYYHIILDYELYFQNDTINDLVYTFQDVYSDNEHDLLPIKYDVTKYYDNSNSDVVSRTRISYDNLYGINHTVNVTIAYPSSKADDFIGLNDYWMEIDSQYDAVIAWANNVGDTSTLLGTPENYIIRTFKVNVTENSVNEIYFKVSTAWGEEAINLAMWVNYNPGGGGNGWDAEFQDTDGITWYIAKFNESGNFTVPDYLDYVDVLVVAGGGGSGKGTTSTTRNGGAGGAGGLIWMQDYPVTPGTNISYSVGSGGAGAISENAKGVNGDDTTFGNLTAKGGGGGGGSSYPNTAFRTGADGGSGGGGALYSSTYYPGGTGIQPSQDGWSGEYGYGNDGGGAGGGAFLKSGSEYGSNPGMGMDMSAYFGTSYGVSGVFAQGGVPVSSSAGPTDSNTGYGGYSPAASSADNGRPGDSGIILIRWTTITNPNPKNNATNQPLDLTWSCYIGNLNTTFNWTIECSNGQSNSSNDDEGGIKYLDLSALEYSSTYTIWVNATNVTNFFNRTYYFSTIQKWVDNSNTTWTIMEFIDEKGNWDVPENVTKLDVLVVAGGGGSGSGSYAGGGGSGGLIWIQNYSVMPGESFNYSVGVGGIGSLSTSSKGTSGEDSTFGNLTAKGGGGGGSTGNTVGLSGGSGGGGVSYSASSVFSNGGTGIQLSEDGWSGIYGYGNNGYSGCVYGGGGGGAYEATLHNGGLGKNLSAYFGTKWGNSGIFAGGGNAHSDSAGPTDTNSGYGGNAQLSSGNGRPGDSGIILIRWAVISNTEPEHNAINQYLDLTWSCYIGNLNTTFNWTIECSNGQSNLANNDENGTKSLDISGLDYNTQYTVWVNVTAGIDIYNSEYIFTTFDIWTDSNNIHWAIYDLKDNGEFVVPENVTKLDVLVVAGGGGAGKGTSSTTYGGGAGGAGGLIWMQDYPVTPGTNISYSVGSGGYGTTSDTVRGEMGGDTTFGNLTAKGGGGAGSMGSAGVTGVRTGLDGGSGGGGGRWSNTWYASGNGIQPDQSGWSGTHGYGNAGGTAGSGGGAGGAGIGSTGGSGMDMSAYFGTSYGVSGVFAQGGTSNAGTLGPVSSNTGYGGNPAALNSNRPGYPGDSGIILIRWATVKDVTPINNSENQPFVLTWSCYIGNLGNFNWTIECSNGQSNSANDEVEGTKSLSLFNLTSITKYTIWLNVSSSNRVERYIFYFTTSNSFTDTNGVTWNIALLTTDGTYIIPDNVKKVDILAVAGGGGAGLGWTTYSYNGGGGGAGGLIWMQNVTEIGEINIITGSQIPYKIGVGGASNGGTGGDTTFGNLTAKGGGGGGAYNSRNGKSGGSGGGAGCQGSSTGTGGTGIQPSQDGWSGEYGYGNDGGTSSTNNARGGGGAGGTTTTTTGGAGMDMSLYFGTSYGNSGVFASGGGAHNVGVDALANSGMGGRAQATTSSASGRPGGSGVILIRWTSQIEAINELPANNSIDVTGLLNNWSIYIYHENTDNSSGTIECSNGDSTSWTDEGDGTKTLTFTGYLDYNTTYYVWVNATVGGSYFINEIFNFKTTTCKITGTILDVYNESILNVKVVASGDQTYETYTDNNGYYEFDDVVYGEGVTYTITPSKFAYVFNPDYKNEDLTRNVSNVDFTGVHYFYKGAGTIGDPFTIKNCSNLNNMRLFSNYTFVLNNDLDMAECNITNWNGGKGFEPICNETTPFTGTFDGGGYIISNLFINYTDMEYVGLFGYVENSDIRNLGLISPNITKGNYTGAIAGYVNNTTIQVCFASGNESIVGNNYAGGLVGVLDNSSIINSYARVPVTGNIYGGLIGLNKNSLVNYTYSTGNVTGGGGLIGENQGTANNSYFDNETSGTQTSDGGIGYNTATMTSLSFWQQTNFSFPQIWFYDQNQNDKYPILSIFISITPPLLREINNAGSLTQQIHRYLNSSYNPEDYCFFNLTAFVPQERYTGRWNKNVSDRYFIATGVEEEDWSDTKDNYVLASRVIATYTGYYDQMRVFTVWHGHYPSTLGCAIYSDKNGEPGDILGYTDAWNFPADRDSIWFPDYSHVWLTLDLYTPVLLAKDTAYWLLVTTNDSSMWRESYAMPGMNLSGMSDFIWTLGTTVGDEANVKMLPYNVTLNIPNKEYINGEYGFWRGDVWNSTFSWPASFESAGWEQGKDSITSTNLSQLLIYTLCSVDVSQVDITNVTMTWGTGYEESIVWDEPVNLSRVSPDLNYWEYNKTDISGGDWNTWKATLYDEFGNVESYDYYRWMNHGVTERIYFQCNVTTPPEGVKILNSTTDLYSNDWVFYLYEAYYDNTPDVYGDNEGRKQALRHEQGVDGSAYDTGYWTTEVPTDLYQERTCAFFVGGVWDQDVVITDNITIENAFVSWWMGSGRQLIANSTGAAQNIHYGRADTEASFDEFYIDDYGYGEWRAVTYDGLEDTIAWQDMPLTRRPSNDWINFNESTWYEPPLFDNSTGRITDKIVRQVVQKLNFSSLAGTDYPNTFDSNSIYQLFAGIDYDAMWASGANAILANNRSHPTFIIFNVPEDEELMSMDSNNDGITDYEELCLYGLQPFWDDTDNDSFTDIQELSRDTGANLYRDYPGDSNIILIKDMKPFKGNSTDEWSITLSVTIENPNEQDMDVKWYILKDFKFNSSYINQNELLEGYWDLVQTNASVSDGTYTMTYAPASGDNHWAVYASDGAWWGNRSSVFSGPNRQINGTILKDGYGLEGVNVTAVANDTGITYYDYTDSDGYYLITNISGGNYVITPTSEGYYFIPYDKSVSLTYENLTVDFESVDILYSAESPYNNSWDANNSLVWSILIEHKYEFDWSIECSDGNSSSDTTDTTGRKNLTLSGLEYDTWYSVWVNSSNSEHSYIINNGTYRFKVREEKIDYPSQPLDFTATTYNYTRIDLSWSKGVNATNTYIRYAVGSVPPANRSSGIFLYNNTGTSLNVEDLEQGTEYSFSAWSWNETYNSWSYMVIDSATTDEEPQEPDYLDLSIAPGSIDFGLVDIGEYTRTTDYYFNLTNNGMGCIIEISISNSQNWTFTNFTERGHNKFSMNLSKDNWASEENIKTDGITLVENLIWQDSVLFDIKLLMPTSLSKLSDGETITITFTATPT
jgi:hypothetical protein